MTELHPRASYVALEWRNAELLHAVLNLYGKSAPNKPFSFGPPSYRSLLAKLIVPIEELSAAEEALHVCGLTDAPSAGKDRQYSRRSVFLAQDLTKEEKLLLLSQGSDAIIPLCGICFKPLCEGEHK